METKLIKNPAVARYLLNHGYMIVDIKPSRELKNASVFIFRVGNKEKFDIDFNKALDSLHKGKNDIKENDDIEKAKKLMEFIKSL